MLGAGVGLFLFKHASFFFLWRYMSSLTLQCKLLLQHLFSSFRDSVRLWKGRIRGRWQREGHRWWGRRVLEMSAPLHLFSMGRPSLWGPTRSVTGYCMPLELVFSRNWAKETKRETKPLLGSRRGPEGKEASSSSFPVTHRYQHKCLSLIEGSICINV